eukprot:12764299-Alexandrium_andersonii.AAC.1
MSLRRRDSATCAAGSAAISRNKSAARQSCALWGSNARPRPYFRQTTELTPTGPREAASAQAARPM